MCGIILLVGPAAQARLPECMRRLQHRGPDDQAIYLRGDAALGFVRLAINGDVMAGRQPQQHGDWVGVVNGEIYNHQELKRRHGLPSTDCDTDVVLPLIARQGPHCIDEFDGFYSAVLLQADRRVAVCLRDPMGKKPLFVGRSYSELFISSELKALEECTGFKMLPLGASEVDLDTGAVRLISSHRAVYPARDLVAAFEQAVYKRMPAPDRPVGVFLSGGLDSALIAAYASRFRDDVTYFTLGNSDGPDRKAVVPVVASLGLRDVRTVALPPSADIPSLIRAVVRATESFNPSVVSNGLATYLLAHAAHAAGIKVVLTGEGADELFGGYHAFLQEDVWRGVRGRLIDEMQLTELRRLDLSCMAHSVEPRCPFLDREVRAVSDALDHSEFYDGGENKVSLRRCFKGVLPRDVLTRQKTSFDVGSGIRAQVVDYLRSNARSEREELRAIWRTIFSHDDTDPYFHAYPVFDEAIDRRGGSHR